MQVSKAEQQTFYPDNRGLALAGQPAERTGERLDAFFRFTGHVPGALQCLRDFRHRSLCVFRRFNNFVKAFFQYLESFADGESFADVLERLAYLVGC